MDQLTIDLLREHARQAAAEAEAAAQWAEMARRYAFLSYQHAGVARHHAAAIGVLVEAEAREAAATTATSAAVEAGKAERATFCACGDSLRIPEAGTCRRCGHAIAEAEVDGAAS